MIGYSGRAGRAECKLVAVGQIFASYNLWIAPYFSNEGQAMSEPHLSLGIW